MKLKFLHDTMKFNQVTAKEELIKAGQTVEIPDLDAPSFLSGDNPRAEKVLDHQEKAAPKVESKAVATPIKKAVTKQATKKAAPKKASKK